MEDITVTVKSVGQTYTVSLPPSATVSHFKALLAAQAHVPSEEQRLIYAGRILKDDDTVQACGMQHTLERIPFSP